MENTWQMMILQEGRILYYRGRLQDHEPMTNLLYEDFWRYFDKPQAVKTPNAANEILEKYIIHDLLKDGWEPISAGLAEGNTLIYAFRRPAQ